ncbi:hypothetical protein GUJ93_ZPchr0012g19052 [Zizania palustris]|uniref:Uncharacterized protein n=1 Tax=Zizania palustris TaxID=103762 RepID=A0A8J6BSJ5_ZIZPA|nr:hypothetical protein GUJ93_ZPchr0012g19052 [Zizania palustris]
MWQQYFEAGFDVITLDLEVLNGPALLVDVPRDTNITAEAMESLNIQEEFVEFFSEHRTLTRMDYLSVTSYDYLFPYTCIIFEKQEIFHAYYQG